MYDPLDPIEGYKYNKYQSIKKNLYKLRVTHQTKAGKKIIEKMIEEKNRD